jgi:hypothetical protein
MIWLLHLLPSPLSRRQVFSLSQSEREEGVGKEPRHVTGRKTTWPSINHSLLCCDPFSSCSFLPKESFRGGRWSSHFLIIQFFFKNTCSLFYNISVFPSILNYMRKYSFNTNNVSLAALKHRKYRKHKISSPCFQKYHS